MDDARKTDCDYYGVSIDLATLFDLEARLVDDGNISEFNVRPAVRAVLKWAADHQMLQPARHFPVPVGSPIGTPAVTCDLDPLSHQEITQDFRQVLMGRCAPSIDPQPSPLAEQPAPESEVEDLPPEPTSPADDGAVAGSAAPEAGAEAATSAPSGEVVMGPLSDHEKAVMASAKLKGRPAADVAADRNRRLQTVAIYMSKLPSGVDDPEQNDAPDVTESDTEGRAESLGDCSSPEYAEHAQVQAEEVRCASRSRSSADRPLDPETPHSIEAHLNAVGQKGGWTTGRDIVLIEGLAKGIDKALMADQLGVEVGELMARFRALVPGGKFESMEHQRKLMQVLRARYEREA